MVFNSSAGANKALGPFSFFPESSIFRPFANFLLAFPFKCHFSSFPNSNAKATHVDLAILYKLGPGHHRVMIYIYIGAL